MNEITMIPIGLLEHHPENPRTDMGDLTELTESIRARGIMQNLTVVPDEKTDKYLVVIGNRRLEAAKAAGLVDLPCFVDAKMDHKMQVATMLEENMHREDLTPYEQAQGFQLMMDLGFTEKEIGEKTGFSTKTIKDRLKLTKLNKKEFTKAVERGANLIDMIEVTKLESKTAQNHVLEAAGTENFRQRMQSALKDQEFEKGKKRLVPVLKEAGVEEIPKNERYGGKWEHMFNTSFDMKKSEDELRKHLKKIMTDPDLKYRYEMDNYYSGPNISFYHSKPKPGPMSEEQKSDRKKALERGKHLRYVKSFWAQAYDLRKEFVMNYSVANGQSASTIGKILVKHALSKKDGYNGEIGKNHDWSDKLMREMLNLPEKPVKDESYEEDPERPYHTEYLSIWQQIDGKDIPMVRVMIIWAVCGGVFWPDAPDHGSYDFAEGTYSAHSYQNNGVRELYDFLVEIGYQMSDMEKQLLDGTHECYQPGAGV